MNERNNGCIMEREAASKGSVSVRFFGMFESRLQITKFFCYCIIIPAITISCSFYICFKVFCRQAYKNNYNVSGINLSFFRLPRRRTLL